MKHTLTGSRLSRIIEEAILEDIGMDIHAQVQQRMPMLDGFGDPRTGSRRMDPRVLQEPAGRAAGRSDPAIHGAKRDRLISRKDVSLL